MQQNHTVDIQIDVESNFVEVVVSGLIQSSDAIHLIDKVVGSAGFKRNMNSMIDLRGAKFNANANDFECVTAAFLLKQIERGHGFKIAFLVADDLSFGLCRMLAVDLEQVPIYARVMKHREEALKWVVEKDVLVSSFETA